MDIGRRILEYGYRGRTTVSKLLAVARPSVGCDAIATTTIVSSNSKPIGECGEMGITNTSWVYSARNVKPLYLFVLISCLSGAAIIENDTPIDGCPGIVNNNGGLALPSLIGPPIVHARCEIQPGRFESTGSDDSCSFHPLRCLNQEIVR
ncbi:MAG: hypothetical protein AAF664_25010 [Planctomycetota bacterium]